MEVSYVEINDCCRCCMNFTEDLDNIFECFYKNLELYEILSIITGLSFSLDDGFPQSICEQCKEITMRAFDFRELCHNSETEIQSLKESEIQNENFETQSEENFNEAQPELEIFSCPICQNVFESSEKLALHVINSHQVTEVETKPISAPSSGGRKYECHICNKMFTSPWKLRRHFLVHKDLLDPSELPKMAPKIYKHECPECGKRVETPSKLQRHMSVHDKKNRYAGVNQDRPVACNECPQRFRDKVKLERHQFLHTDEFEKSKIQHPKGHTFTCVICLAQLPSYDECNDHMRGHREDFDENSQITCRLCSRIYPKLANVIRHSKLHSENATNECTYCGKRFGFGEDFIDHMLRHQGFKPFSCEYPNCGKSFIKAHKLKLHQATHNESAVKCFQCDLCDKKFSEIEYLKKHLFRHIGIKTFACNLCPGRFANKSGLESHITTHTNEKKFKCDICSARFTKMQTLNVHLKIHKNEKAYACKYCTMKFIASGPLKRHLRIHTLEKPYKCNYCEKAYAQSNDLMKHLKIHLGPNVYLCTMCSQGFAKFKQLKDHKMEHYKNDPNLLKEAEIDQDENFETKKSFENEVVKLQKVSYNISEEVYEKIFYRNASMFLKSWNRRSPTLNFYFFAKMPINQVFIWLNLYYKSNNEKYRKVLFVPKLEFCSVLKSSINNILVKQIIDVFNQTRPGLVHECPYISVEVYNLTFKNHELFTILPSGNFQVWLNLYYKSNDEKYRKVLFVPKFEACSLLKSSTTNLLLKNFLNFLSQTVPGLIHECPYISIEVYNVTLKNHELLTILPSGNFQLTMDFGFLNNEEPDVYVTIEYILNTIKDRLGVNKKKIDSEVLKIEKLYYNISEDIKEQIVYNNFSFYIKNWNRRYQTLNLYAILKKPITKIYVWLNLFYKGNSNTFRKVLSAPKFEVCQVLKSSTSNTLVKQLIDFINKAIPGFLHECPFTSIIFYNVTLPNHEIMNLVPSGNYQITIELGILTTDVPDIYVMLEFTLKDRFRKKSSD
ncbi:hypothetical protein PVAND_017219 [Polypedilum vanderplanki]|uniref:Zinc finger protein n=1 Tax=Polypedilum vanderplanki TaxID=319348 RepID=A0A9J6BIF8_POLVA|nr:hypothetical protein PVAND_017219 [Polypedilum vanderplanki]